MSGFDTLKICAAAILAVICFTVVKRVNQGFDMPLRLAAAAVFFGVVLSVSLPLFSYVSDLVLESGLGEWQGVLFGAFGVALMTHITAELCRECGEGSIGGYVELAGKLEIVAISLPIAADLLNLARELIA